MIPVMLPSDDLQYKCWVDIQLAAVLASENPRLRLFWFSERSSVGPCKNGDRIMTMFNIYIGSDPTNMHKHGSTH